jgi:hypothetical protein
LPSKGELSISDYSKGLDSDAPFGRWNAVEYRLELISAKVFVLQRLYSMFPDGWPGRGLLLLRLTGGLLVLLTSIAHWSKGVHIGPDVLVLAASLFSFLVLLGLWTPVAGLLSAGAQTVLLMKQADDPRILVCLIGINLAIAMLGPGDVSIDAVIFGRHRLDIPER